LVSSLAFFPQLAEADGVIRQLPVGGYLPIKLLPKPPRKRLYGLPDLAKQKVKPMENRAVLMS